MEILALFPGLISAAVAFGQSPQRAFLSVYLPVLLLLPEYYRWIAPGLPDPTFSQAAILPVAAAFLLREASGWRFSIGDLLVFGFAFSVGYSEYLNAGYKEAQNLMFDMLGWVVLPYAIAKGLIEPSGLRVAFARRFVFLLFMVAVTAVYEFTFGMCPFRLFLDPFFPWQAVGWVTTFRYGFARVAGPYGHAILAGVMLVVGFRIQRWLEWSGLWEARFKKANWLPLSKATTITLGLLAGVIMTLVRGPWLGAILAGGVTAIGRARDRKKAVAVAAALIGFVGVPAMIALYSYASVGRENATTPSQESAAYRKELIDEYVDIAIERSVWGWGRTTWPKISGMPSIDNYYLLLALMHGLTALCFLLAIFLVMMVRLFLHAMSNPPPATKGGSLGFTLLGVYAAIGLSIGTVYMGNQVIPMFFLITGWAEGYLLSGSEISSPGQVAEPVRSHHFRRVLT